MLGGLCDGESAEVAQLHNLRLTRIQLRQRGQGIDLIALDDALSTLAELDPRQAQVVELRYFGGLSIAEAAEQLDISIATVKRDWESARVWLTCQLAR